GKGEGSAARATLDAEARAAGVADRVAWHGHPPPDVRLGLYRRAAALVVGAHSAAQPQTVAEAQLCATPVVALDMDGAADLVRHEHTGALVPAGDPGALAAALDDLLAHPDRAAALGQAARMHALGTFAPESAARRYAMLYRSILADTTAH
ncbi:MAG: glycosyltransferase, partial [Gemmatimonadaceae bacterium]|nr:glycosyltransferase [Gemmatimonadaceae bacterium]